MLKRILSRIRDRLMGQSGPKTIHVVDDQIHRYTGWGKCNEKRRRL